MSPQPSSPSARRLWTLIEPIHAVTYFSPEPLEALRQAGFRGFWMGYFAGRAAPLGPVPAGVVHALFYNFSLEQVCRSLPDAWKFGMPAAALEARLAGSVAALRRLIGPEGLIGPDGPALARTADLAMTAALAGDPTGRALFAANLALPIPDAPWDRLWHAATLLREHRGDGHVAALLVAGLTGAQAHRLHAAATGTPQPTYQAARGLTPERWAQAASELRDRGLLDDAGALTAAGASLKEQVERHTDELAAGPVAALTPKEYGELVAGLRPIAASVVAGGEIPTQSPMGLDLRDALAETPNSR